MTGFPVEQRAGGIIFRKANPQIEYLLVTSNSNKERWIFPAGHVEAGVTDAEAALREVREEAGVQAEIVADLGCYQYNWFRNKQRIILNTHLFLMEFVTLLNPNSEGRRVQFFPYETILKLNPWDESKALLKHAHQVCSKLIN